MSPLTRHKGSTLVEVMCSLMVFSILFMETSNVMKQCIVLKKCNMKKKENIILLQQIEGKILHEDTKSVFDDDNACFIGGEFLNPDSMKNLHIEQMASRVQPSAQHYCEIQHSKEQEAPPEENSLGKQAIQIKVSMHFMEESNAKTVDLNFIKGE